MFLLLMMLPVTITCYCCGWFGFRYCEDTTPAFSVADMWRTMRYNGPSLEYDQGNLVHIRSLAVEPLYHNVAVSLVLVLPSHCVIASTVIMPCHFTTAWMFSCVAVLLHQYVTVPLNQLLSCPAT